MVLDLRIRRRGVVVLAAGGTGGHLFPAQALAEVLVKRGYLIHLMSDERAAAYGGKFPAVQIHRIPSATLSLRRPWRLPRQALRLWQGYRTSRELLERLEPHAVVGFGGYPAVPPLLAAHRLGLPMAVHESNAVMGRANRALASRARLIASSFPEIVNLSPRLKQKVALTGNPVRESVLAAARTPYRGAKADEPFHLLVFGGSQGAQIFSQLMPAVLRELPNAVRRTLLLTQQCRAEDIDAMRKTCVELDLKADLQPFFADLPERIAAAHLVLCRSGATTIAELGVIGRPALLVPLPHAIDNDQLRNAEAFARAGAGWILRQGEFGANELAAFITRLRFADGELAVAASAARELGAPDAALRLADAIERMILEAESQRSDAMTVPETKGQAQ